MGTAAAANEAVRADYADPDNPGLPAGLFDIDLSNTAVVVTDLQIDFLSPDGVTWGVVGENVIEHRTVDNLEKLVIAAKSVGMLVFVSPHYYYPHDHEWRFEGALEKVMHNLGMFDRKSPLSLSDIGARDFADAEAIAGRFELST